MVKPVNDEDLSIQKSIKEKMVELKRAQVLEDAIQQSVPANQRRRQNDKAQRSAEAAQLYEDLIKAGNEVVSSGQKGYDNYTSCMGAVLELCHKMAAALRANNIITATIHKVVDAIMPTVETLGIKLKHGTWEKLFTSKVTLPSLQHNVECSPEGKITVKPVTDNLPIELPDDKKEIINTAFEQGIEAWLKELGYEPVSGQEGKYKEIGSDTLLTQAKFTALKNDPDTGLDSFLSGRFKMTVEAAPSSPSPSP